ncbi:MAG: hypothetical protein DHS20C20_12020 [Ardenticatenaceae bacterium]|nr:MAG: hypothetical protein DHS20C20_12020 [Ardenticatenaceae bacterium]
MALSRRDLFLGHFLQEETASKTATSAGSVQAVSTTDPTLHFLQRITYGPRPAEVARARQIGIEATLEEQLNPDQIEDAEADGRLRNLPLLNMDRHSLHRLTNSEYRSYRALIEGMITRAVYSKRQLLERMVEFWSDHFNISGDEYTRDLLVFQREAIRANALGSFRDLLFATAKSPAMLTYLDNYINIAEAPNENYAREIMELHTLGVNGGYTENDVKEVARAFTGWTIHNGTRTGFYFNSEEHDSGPKVVLGHALPGGRGIEDGLHVLNILTEHPATARFICTKLCVRFVSDMPPASLIDRLTAVWQQSSGDIKTVLRTLFLSDEFFNSAGQKFKRPLDFFIGALRATDTQFKDWWRLEEMMYQLGQPPYGWPPPNGYPDVAAAWQNSGGLLARWNIAMSLTHGAYEDIYDDGYSLTTNLHERIGQPETVSQLVDAVAEQLLGAPLAGEAKVDFVNYVTDGTGNGETASSESAEVAVTPHLLARKLASLFGLMLASPAFQWR